MSRPPQPEDLYRFRIPTDPHLSPDGKLVAFTIQTAAPGRDAYRHAIAQGYRFYSYGDATLFL